MMRSRRALGALAVGLSLAGALAGCGKSTDGSPVASSTVATTSNVASTSTDAAAAVWDPCQLPESAVSATGLKPESKVADVAGVKFPGWKVCSWQATSNWYDLTVYSGTATLQDVRQRSDFEDFTTTSVEGRDAVQFLNVGDDKRLICDVAVGLHQGSVIFEVQTRYSIGKQGDPCAEVKRHADDLAKELPSQ